MTSRPHKLLGFGLALLLAVTIAVASGANATGKATLSNDEALGLSGDGLTLRIFKLSNPSDDVFIGKATGFENGNVKLVAIDYRVSDGTFYGVGVGPSDSPALYTINTKTGALTFVTSIPLVFDGKRFDMDWDPSDGKTVRIVDDQGTNASVTQEGPGSHLIDQDTDLTAKGITGLAFTNNDQNADQTGSRALYLQNFPGGTPNKDSAGTLFPVEDGNATWLGNLGVDVSPVIGFDIKSKVENGRTVSNTAYAALRSTTTSQPDLYEIDVLSGKSTKIGDFDKQVADIAVKQP